MARKRKPSEAELANDPSLRWNPDYKWGEVLLSDTHGECLRFHSRDGYMLYLAMLGGITKLPDPVHMLSVRRGVFVMKPATQEDKEAITARLTASFAVRNYKGA